MDNLLPFIGPVEPKDPKRMTKAKLRACAPISLRANITDKHVDLINSCVDDSSIRDSFRDNILQWSGVLSQGKYKYKSYIRAVSFVTHMLLGDKARTAWTKAFPDKFQRLVDMGKPNNVIAAHVNQYLKSGIVMKIMERTLPPVHVLNADLLQEAINVSAELMRSARSETVRQKSAATLIEHLKPPESLKVDLNVGVSNDSLEDLRNITRGLAVEQRKMIESGGMTAGEVAEMEVIKKVELKADDVIEAKFEEVGYDEDKRHSEKLFWPEGN